MSTVLCITFLIGLFGFLPEKGERELGGRSSNAISVPPQLCLRLLSEGGAIYFMASKPTGRPGAPGRDAGQARTNANAIQIPERGLLDRGCSHLL